MYLECCVKCCKIKVYLNVLTEDDPAEVTFTPGKPRIFHVHLKKGNIINIH